MEDVVRFVQSRIYTVRIWRADCHRRREPKGPLVSMLVLRAMSLYSGVSIVAQRGLGPESAVLCRSILEVLFKCLAIVNAPEAALIYLAEDEHYRLGLVKNLLKHPEFYKDFTTETELRAALAKVQKAIKDSGHEKAISIKAWAEYGDMIGMYRTAYADLSNAVHVGVRRLEPMFVMDAGGQLESFAFEPYVDERVLVCATESVIILCKAFAWQMGLDFTDDLDPFLRRLKELGEDMEKDRG
jgi:Family of unknown function (DUF5677)